MVQATSGFGSLVYEAVFKLFAHQVHRGNLRFGQSLDVARLSDRDVAVTENRLDPFVGNTERMKIRCKPAAKGVPPAPYRNVFVLLEEMAVRFVFILRDFADAALFDRLLDHAASCNSNYCHLSPRLRPLKSATKPLHWRKSRS